MVDIIIPTYNQENYTVTAIQSIIDNTDKDNYRIIWIDDCSDVNSRKEVMNFLIDKGIKYKSIFLSKNVGFIGSVNKGLSYCLAGDSKYICICNNDIIVTEKWLSTLLNVLESDSSIGAVGPVTGEINSWQSFQEIHHVFSDFNVPIDFKLLDHSARQKVLYDTYQYDYKLCKMLAFFCTLFKVDVFKKVGFLDIDFGLGYGDDDDFCYRMKNSNYFCALSLGSYVVHNHNTSFSDRFSKEKVLSLKKEATIKFHNKHGVFPSVK